MIILSVYMKKRAKKGGAMPYPTVTEAILPSIGEVTFRLTHAKEFCDPAQMTSNAAHVHGCYEIYIHVGGDITFLHGQDIHKIAPYDVIFSRPGDVHYCIYKGATIHNHYCIWFDGASALSDFVKNMSIPPHIRLANTERLQALLKILEEDCNPYLRTAYFTELLALLGTDARSKETEISPSDSKLNEILTYVGEHYLEDLSSADIATRFFISESTLNRLFRTSVGMSPFKFIEAKRISYAEKLLCSGYSVTDACFRAGFSDCSRFIIKFKEKFGITPKRYQQALRVSKENKNGVPPEYRS